MCVLAGVCHLHVHASHNSGVGGFIWTVSQPAAVLGHSDSLHLTVTVLYAAQHAVRDRGEHEGQGFTASSEHAAERKHHLKS